MPFELFVALRYLLARRKQAFISLISLISTLGVAVGVMALVIALALMTGLQGELRDRILGSMAHVYVWKTGGISDYHAEVEKLRADSGRGRRRAGDPRQGADLERCGDAFITLKGIDPGSKADVTDIQRAMQQGSVERARADAEDELPGHSARARSGRTARRDGRRPGHAARRRRARSRRWA